jgi:hypothetical protein
MRVLGFLLCLAVVVAVYIPKEDNDDVEVDEMDYGALESVS